MFPGGVKYNTASFAILLGLIGVYAYGYFTGTQNYIIPTYGVSLHSPSYTWITYAFIHGGILHIVMNSLVLMQTGHIIEDWMGVKRFLFFSMLCAVFAGLGGTWLGYLIGQPNTILIGYSGVIFGYFGVLGFMVVSRARDKKKALIDIAIQNPLLVALIILPFVMNIGISGEGHLMGLIFGAATAKYFLK